MVAFNKYDFDLGERIGGKNNKSGFEKRDHCNCHSISFLRKPTYSYALQDADVANLRLFYREAGERLMERNAYRKQKARSTSARGSDPAHDCWTGGPLKTTWDSLC
jgi:hypothetical protein